MVGSALARASGSMEWLIMSRAVQGLGAGGIPRLSRHDRRSLPARQAGPCTGTVCRRIRRQQHHRLDRRRYLVDSVNWRWILYINLPAGFIALVVSFFARRNTGPGGKRPPIDYLGAAVLTSAITTTLLITIWGW